MEDCIFCKIIDNQIPSRKVFENDDILAFFDTSQATPGHTLIVPKKHVENIMDYDDELAATVFSYLPQIARGIKKSHPNIQGINIINNNGEIAYQTVFHSHIHVIPRYGTNDSFSMTMGNNSDQYKDEDLDQLADKVKESIKGE
ncbi:MAG: HIT domain-containing protein [Atopococcus tabaci]|uniref:HIT domain-containing protein n=1 Tax=Atopococcus tabaci TaxID=269774 RepID=A0AA43UC86_9LACT|nr:HIT domain-containing protein [Atopococcus tabaci]